MPHAPQNGSPLWVRCCGTAAFLAGAAALVILAADAPGQQGEVLGPPSCTNANCHAGEAGWWNGDPHKRTADAYLEADEDFNQMALAAGVNPDDPAAMNARCFTCHGTVVAGAEKEEIEYGVSCESCHGPGSLYKDPHQESYDAGVQAGMAALKDVQVRAQMCITCHLVTDQKLLRVHSAGWTSSGKYTRGMKGVSGHWKEFIAEDKDGAPFDGLLADQRVVVPPPAPSTDPAVRAVTQTPAQRPAAPAPSVQRVVIKEISGPWLLLGPDNPKPIRFPTFVPPPDTAGFQVQLTALQRRLAAVYAALDSTYGN